MGSSGEKTGSVVRRRLDVRRIQTSMGSRAEGEHPLRIPAFRRAQQTSVVLSRR